MLGRAAAASFCRRDAGKGRGPQLCIWGGEGVCAKSRILFFVQGCPFSWSPDVHGARGGLFSARALRAPTRSLSARDCAEFDEKCFWGHYHPLNKALSCGGLDRSPSRGPGGHPFVCQTGPSRGGQPFSRCSALRGSGDGAVSAAASALKDSCVELLQRRARTSPPRLQISGARQEGTNHWPHLPRQSLRFPWKTLEDALEDGRSTAEIMEDIAFIRRESTQSFSLSCFGVFQANPEGNACLPKRLPARLP